jgi:hypothetical protein
LVFLNTLLDLVEQREGCLVNSEHHLVLLAVLCADEMVILNRRLVKGEIVLILVLLQKEFNIIIRAFDHIALKEPFRHRLDTILVEMCFKLLQKLFASEHSSY